jgi:tetratricopeptide (TPR) repeat protein
VSDSPQIDDLRRRVERDPTSIAFAQLAEELRRAGQMQEAIETCRTGLITHPSYVSARVTLARALAALDRLDEAQAELERVLRSAPDTLTAVRGLADIFYRRGNMPEALMRYRAALSLAPNDPELPQIVARSVSEKREHAPKWRLRRKRDHTETQRNGDFKVQLVCTPFVSVAPFLCVIPLSP